MEMHCLSKLVLKVRLKKLLLEELWVQPKAKSSSDRLWLTRMEMDFCVKWK